MRKLNLTIALNQGRLRLRMFRLRLRMFRLRLHMFRLRLRVFCLRLRMLCLRLRVFLSTPLNRENQLIALTLERQQRLLCFRPLAASLLPDTLEGRNRAERLIDWGIIAVDARSQLRYGQIAGDTDQIKGARQSRRGLQHINRPTLVAAPAALWIVNRSDHRAKQRALLKDAVVNEEIGEQRG